MRILITGGAGFIGSHLCDRLSAEGHELLCLDNLLTGSESNLESLKAHPRFRFLRQDICRPLEVEGAIDEIFHLASPASPVDYAHYPLETLETGSIGTLNVLRLAQAKKARFLLASTSEVYGDPEVHPQQESYWGHVNPIGPRSCYDEAKRFSEALTMAFHRTGRVATRIVRVFNTYGPRMRAQDGRAIPNLITQALSAKPLTVYGNGSQTRSFCYVTDLVEGICRLMQKGSAEPVNLGNPREVTLSELARKILALTRQELPITFLPLPQDDPRRRCPDISKAKNLMDWEPKVGLDEGLLKTIAWFRETIVSS